MVRIFAITTSPSPLALALQKKITTLKKRCTIGIGMGNSPLQHLHQDLIIPISIAKKFAFAETYRGLNVTIEGRTISLCSKPTYLDM